MERLIVIWCKIWSCWGLDIYFEHHVQLIYFTDDFISCWDRFRMIDSEIRLEKKVAQLMETLIVVGCKIWSAYLRNWKFDLDIYVASKNSPNLTW